ncbi:MAG: DUF3349 domain-containing protein [Gordonia sp. (in: high G+C Gram-positive bacteria)]
MAHTLFDNVVNWIRQGYPEGVPPADYPPLLALLTPMLSESDITDVVLSLAVHNGTETATTRDQIKAAIERVTENKPSDEEIKQVSSRLAAAGWPLSTPVSASH